VHGHQPVVGPDQFGADAVTQAGDVSDGLGFQLGPSPAGTQLDLGV